MSSLKRSSLAVQCLLPFHRKIEELLHLDVDLIGKLVVLEGQIEEHSLKCAVFVFLGLFLVVVDADLFEVFQLLLERLYVTIRLCHLRNQRLTHIIVVAFTADIHLALLELLDALLQLCQTALNGHTCISQLLRQHLMVRRWLLLAPLPLTLGGYVVRHPLVFV